MSVLSCANVRSCPGGGFLLHIPHGCNVHERKIQHLTHICRYSSQEGETDRQLPNEQLLSLPKGSQMPTTGLLAKTDRHLLNCTELHHGMCTL